MSGSVWDRMDRSILFYYRELFNIYSHTISHMNLESNIHYCYNPCLNKNFDLDRFFFNCMQYWKFRCLQQEMTTNQFFLQATDHFYKNQYEQGLQKINLCIQIHQNNSTLLANRALFYSQMGHLEKAIQQLQNCIRLDYQNYIPYFNLFSLKVRKGQLEEALKELGCSLSCLYLMRARFRKRDQDAKESIKYAKNNVQAHVLRGMMLLQSKKLRECMNELDWAYEYDQNMPTLNKIRSIVQRKLGIGQTSNQVTGKNVNFHRLICSYQNVQKDLMMQIRMKMQQFNSVYNDLNQEKGIVTHRVPRTLLPQEIQKLLTDNDLKQEIQELYELKYNPDNVNEPVIYQMKQQHRLQNQFEFQERLKEQQDDEANIQNSSHQQKLQDSLEDQIDNSSLIDNADRQDQQEIIDIGHDHKGRLLSDVDNIKPKNLQQNKLNVQYQQDQVSQSEFNQYLVVDQYPQFPPIPQQQSQSKLQPSQSAISQSKHEYFQSSVSSRDFQQSLPLYPMKRKIYARFKIQRLQIDNANKIACFFQTESQGAQTLNHNEMYCVCTYFKEKPGYKVTTCDRGLFFNSDTRMLECQWNQIFKEIPLTQDPQQLFVKIYSKNTDSYNDDLIGIGNKLVQNTGEILLKIHNPNSSSENLGQLYVRLFLIDK